MSRLLTPLGLATSSIAKTAQDLPSRARSMLGWIRDTLGGYPGPSLSRGTSLQDALSSEKAAQGPRGISLPWFLPYVDDLTGETATIRSYYRRMLADPNVKAAVLDKLLSVASLDLQCHPDGDGPLAKKVADFVKWNLTRRLQGGSRKLVESIGFGALIDGYSIVEKIWKPETKGEYADKWILRGLKAKDTGKNVVLETDEFRNVVGVLGLQYNAGETFSPANFLITSHLSIFENPTGMSDFRAVYARWWLLDTTLKLRAIGLEKRAWPILLGTYATVQQKPSIEAALTAARLTTWLSIPQGAKVEALEIAGRSQDEFANCIKDLKHDIFLGIVGAILQALEGNTTDGRGNSQVHRSTADLFKWYLSTLINDSINDHEIGLVPDMVDLNFASAGYPLVTLSAIDSGQLDADLKIDTGLHGMGFDLSKKQIAERYGRNPPIDEADRLPGAPPKPQAPGGAAPAELAERITVNGNSQPAAPEGAARPFRGFREEWIQYLNSN